MTDSTEIQKIEEGVVNLPLEVRSIEWLTALLDDAFRIPYTNFKFGIDPFLSFIPGAGNLLSYLVSSVLIVGMVRNGASGKLAARMILNVVLDVTIGFIPILGNIFDFTYKANRRNLSLMQEHYGEGKHQGSVWSVLIGVVVALVVVFILLIAVVYFLVTALYGVLYNLFFT